MSGIHRNLDPEAHAWWTAGAQPPQQLSVLLYYLGCGMGGRKSLHSKYSQFPRLCPSVLVGLWLEVQV